MYSTGPSSHCPYTRPLVEHSSDLCYLHGTPCRMADPLSVTASAIAVATLAAQVTATLYKLKELHELPGRLHALGNEITDFEVVLRHVASAVKELDSMLEIGRGHALKATLQDGTVKLLQLNAVIQRLQKTCVSRGQFLVRAKAWWIEQPRLLALQKDLRAIKANLNIMLGSTHTQQMIRVHLDLLSVSLTTSQVSDKQTAFQDEMIQTLQQFHTHVDRRLDAMEHALEDQFSRLQNHLGDPVMTMGRSAEVKALVINSRSKNMKKTTSETSIPRFQGISVKTVQYTGIVCSQPCRCVCHDRHEVCSPGFAGPLIGQLFVGYAGLPVFRKQCNNRSCKRRQAAFINIEFWFPLWFLARVIQIMLSCQPTGPQLQLRTLRRVPDSAKCIVFARSGDIEGIKSLLFQGLASVHDVSTTRNFTMLRWAVLMHQYETCRFLLEAGADPHQANASDVLWDHVLRGGLDEAEQDTVRGLLDSSDYVDEQHFATVHKIVLGMSLRSLEDELANNPLAVLETDSNNRTVLFWAAARGNERDIITLLAFGADASAMDKTGRTPIILAANQAHTGCIRLLLEAGANPDPVSPKGVPTRSPALHNAVLHSNDPLTVKIMLDFGANVNSTSPDGETALMIAARSRKTIHAKMLLDAGANLNARSKDGKTALTMSVVYNNNGVLQMLLENWYLYSICPRLDTPDLLDIVADHANIETIKTIAKADHLKLSPDSAYVLTSSALDRVKKRADSSEELEFALRDMLHMLGMPRTEESSKSLLEKGLLKDESSTTSSESEDIVEIFQDALETKIVD